MTAGITRQRISHHLVALVLMLSAAFYNARGAADRRGKGSRRRQAPHTRGDARGTVQWGWLDPKERPKLTVDFRRHRLDRDDDALARQIRPGVTMDEIVAAARRTPAAAAFDDGPDLRERRGAGDVLEIRILKIEPKPFGDQLQPAGQEFPTIGALAPEMPDGFIKFFPSTSRSARGVQARDHARSADPSRHLRGRHRSERSRRRARAA
jgi:hypothetical protein